MSGQLHPLEKMASLRNTKRYLTYADVDPAEIDRFVRSPMFPAWCDRMESKMKDAMDSMKREADEAIVDIELRRKVCS